MTVEVYLYMITGKTIALTIWTCVGRVMSLPFIMLSRFVIAFNFLAVVTIFSDFGAQEKKICHCFHFFPFCLPWSDGTRIHDLSFLNVEFQASFFTLLFHPHQEALQFLFPFCHEWYHLHIWGCWYFSQQSWFQPLIHPAWHFKWCALHKH